MRYFKSLIRPLDEIEEDDDNVHAFQIKDDMIDVSSSKFSASQVN